VRRGHETGCVADRAARIARDTGSSVAFLRVQPTRVLPTPIEALQPNQSDAFPFGKDTDPRHRFAILRVDDAFSIFSRIAFIFCLTV